MPSFLIQRTAGRMRASVADAEVVGLLDVEVRDAREVAVAVVGIVGVEARVLGLRIARIAPAVVDHLVEVGVVAAHAVLEDARLEVVVDRVSQRVVEIDRQREVLVFEGIVVLSFSS